MNKKWKDGFDAGLLTGCFLVIAVLLMIVTARGCATGNWN